MTPARLRRLAVLLLATVAACASNDGLKPVRLQAYGKQHYFQIPPKPRGTAVIIHGCGPGARFFFPQHPTDCPECHDLPEYLAQTKLALARGYAVLVLQANNEGSGCWSSTHKPPDYVDDRPHVVSTVKQWLKDNGLTKKPVYWQGYSSGGTMLLKLPAYLLDQGEKGLRMDGIVAVDAAPRGGFNAADSSGKLRKGLKYPPAVFVTAEGGGSWERAPEQIQMLKSNGVPAVQIVSKARTVGPSYYSDKSHRITRQQSAELVGALRELGGLDAQGKLVNWVLEAAAPKMSSNWLAGPLVWDHVVGPSNVARAWHENMGEFTAASLAWLESKGKANVDTLLRRLVPKRMSAVSVAKRVKAARRAA